MTIKERYELVPNESLLGKRTGVATYLSKDKLLERNICLKIVQVSEREAEALVKVAKKAMLYFHPNLCSYYDVSEESYEDAFGLEQKSVVLVSEYIEGGTIQQYFTGLGNAHNLTTFLIALLKGLEYLHQQGNPHTNLQPSNILVKRTVVEGIPKITDYLLPVQERSKLLNNHSAESVSYKAPELFRNTINSNELEKADWWSFGVILYELLTGKNPFYEDGNSVEQVVQNIAFESVDLSLIENPTYRTILEKTLDRNPKHRPANAQTIIDVLLSKPIDNQAFLFAGKQPIQEAEPIAVVVPEPEKEEAIVVPPVIAPEVESIAVAVTTPVIEKEEEPIIVPVAELKEQEEEIPPIVIPLIETPPVALPISIPPMASEEQPAKNKTKRWVSYGLISLILLSICFAFFQYDFGVLKRNEPIAKPMAITTNITSPSIADTLADTTSNSASMQDSSMEVNPAVLIAEAKTMNPQIAAVPVNTPSAAVVNSTVNTTPSKLPAYDMFYGQVYSFNLADKYETQSAYMWCPNDKAEIKEIGKSMYLVKPLATGEITLFYTDKTTYNNLDTKTYTVTVKPDPKAFVGNELRNTNATKNSVLAGMGLQIIASPNSAYQVKGFRMKVENAETPYEETSMTNLFRQGMIEQIKSAKPGQRLVFDQIRATDENGAQVSVKDIYITITPH